MMSQAGGNLCWYKSPEIWRIGRYNFYRLPTDETGWFLYLQDEDGDVWNPSPLPVHTSLDEFESRHGLGYTKIHSKKNGITTDLLCFVGPDDGLIIQATFRSETKRHLTLYAAMEMGLMEYLREVVWQCYCKNSNDILYFPDGDYLDYRYFIDCQARPEETPEVLFASSLPSLSHTGSRRSFLGDYRDFSRPISIEKRCLPNDDLRGGEATFAMQFALDLEPNTPKDVSFFVMTHHGKDEAKELLARCRKPTYVKEAFASLQATWKKRLSSFETKLPDPEMERMANVWTPYQSSMNFFLARAISFYAPGVGRGIGVRDALQDLLSYIEKDSSAALDRFQLILTQQSQDGKMTHTFFPIEKKPSVESHRSDDHLYPIYFAYRYFAETGDASFLEKKVPYYDGGEGTILEHLRKSLSYSMHQVGPHGIPLMLESDWNDMLTTVGKAGKGESVMVLEQLILVLKQMDEIEKRIGDPIASRQEEIRHFTSLLSEFCDDGDRFVRAFTDEGLALGSKKERCANLWINSQSWAVLSSAAPKDKLNVVMDTVLRELDTPYGLKSLNPPLERDYPSHEHEVTFAQPGIGENGGIFNHANAWALLALLKLGRGDDAYKLYQKTMPNHLAVNVGIERYRAEPYVYASNIRSPDALSPGEAGVSWLSGTATWMNITLEEGFFGFTPTLDGLRLEPSLPTSWAHAKAKRRFRSSLYEVTYENKAGKTYENADIYFDGKLLSSSLLPLLPGTHQVLIRTK